MRLAFALLAAGGLACGGPRAAGGAGPPPALPAVVEGLDAAAARAVLVRFAGALEAGRFDEGFALLSPRWRALTNPARLAADWAGARAVAAEAAARARIRGPGAQVAVMGDQARVDLGEGRTARLVAEGRAGGGAAWRVDALE